MPKTIRPSLCGGAIVACALVGWAFFVAPRTALGAEFDVDTTAANLVRFVSDAPIEDFAGTTSEIDGYVFWPGNTAPDQAPLDSSEFYFEVPLSTLRTGIELRDNHMRERYLESGEFPYASFKGSLQAVESNGEGHYEMLAKGDFSLHGVTRPVEIKAAADGNDGGYRVQSDFIIRLPDYDIDVPSLMFMKISEEIQVHLDFNLLPAPTNP